MIKILILGGGFGGVRTALDLEKKLTHPTSSGQEKIEITVVNRNPYHLFVSALYEIASAYGLKKDPFAVQLKKINLIEAEIIDVNLNDREVRTKGDTVLNYDYLVFSLGSETEDYNIPGVKEYAYKFKSLEDAILINKKLEELSEEFESNTRTDPFSFLICGGGFAGVELAAELSCCSKAIEKRCKFKGRYSSITLFEASPKILPMVSDKERKAIVERMTKLGIIIMESSSVEEVGSDFIKLKTGQRVSGDIIIWNAGVRANSILKGIADLPLTQKGAIIVNANLSVKGFGNIFAVGDNIEFNDMKNQKVVPRLAYVAINQGKIAAKNIEAVIKNKRMKSYDPFYSIWIASIGGKYAIAHLWRRLLIKNGFLGWLVRELVDLQYLLSIFTPIKAMRIFWDEITIFSKND